MPFILYAPPVVLLLAYVEGFRQLKFLQKLGFICFVVSGFLLFGLTFPLFVSILGTSGASGLLLTGLAVGATLLYILSPILFLIGSVKGLSRLTGFQKFALIFSMAVPFFGLLILFSGMGSM